MTREEAMQLDWVQKLLAEAHPRDRNAIIAMAASLYTEEQVVEWLAEYGEYS